VRAGEGQFISNLWDSNPTEAVADPYLAGDSAALPIPPYVKTIMLLGSDYSPGSGHRTDVMLLAAFNLKNGKINLFSFPRDLWVEIPGYYPQRLNVAEPLGGYELLGDTLAYNFGFRPDHYAIADFKGFNLIVDWLGGVDVQVTKHMEDSCFYTQLPPKIGAWLNGTVYMGRRLWHIWYVRARALLLPILTVPARAQEVSKPYSQSAQPSLHFPAASFIETALDVVETDMSVADLWLYAFPLSKFFRQVHI
jgi:LCP family protein required for cell wall assembly